MVSLAVPRLGFRDAVAAQDSEMTAAGKRLTRKELELMNVLIEHEGQCLSRGFLLRRVWGYHEDTRTRTLDVHIQRLRRKLGPGKASRILTILHGGYLWRSEQEPEVRMPPEPAA